jgi:hypothetical protein
MPARTARPLEIAPTPLLPEGFGVPTSRWTHPATRFRDLLRTEPYLFGPGIYDAMGAQLVMYHGFKAVYFSGYSFAIGHLGTTDMDLYSGPEIADGARRAVSALRKFQLTMAVGDPAKGIEPRHIDIPPVVVDMDAGYGNIFNVQRQTELLVTAGVAAAHLEDQVLPKRCGHIGGKALVPALEMIGKLRMMRAVADDLGREDFTVIARTDGLSAIDAPDGDAGPRAGDRPRVPLPRERHPRPVWCEFPTSDRGPVETFAAEVRQALPEARVRVQLVSSSSGTSTRPADLRAARRSRLQVHLHHARAASTPPATGLSTLLSCDGRAPGAGLHRAPASRVRGGPDFPTRSHHEFSWRALPPRDGQGRTTRPASVASSSRAARGEGRLALLPCRACSPSSRARSRSCPSGSSCPRACAAARRP